MEIVQKEPHVSIIGGFPIKLKTQISKLITYSLAIFYNIKIATLYVISLLICVSISIGNPTHSNEIAPNHTCECRMGLIMEGGRCICKFIS